jgi:hypothetical protein
MKFARFALVAALLTASSLATFGQGGSVGGPIGDPPTLPTGTPERAQRFAVIGDFGSTAPGTQSDLVATLVKSMKPAFILTLGDNNYGKPNEIDDNIGLLYHEYIHPYIGAYGEGAGTNRFFPTLGNHDWMGLGILTHLQYFTLPGNERYYEFKRGSTHFFAVDSDLAEPDGNTATSVQALWLKNALRTSNAPIKVVYFHHAPYSSGANGSFADMRWPFRDWGADVVLAGHDHVYERLLVDDLIYVTCGLGGTTRYTFDNILPESEARYRDGFGALFGAANSNSITFRFITTNGAVMDMFTVTRNARVGERSTLVSPGSVWRYDDGGSDLGKGWTAPGFNDAGWASGSGELGYGDADETTVIGYGGDPNNKFITTYFRHAFTVADPTIFDSLRLLLVVDDGVIVHLNGKEVFRWNLPHTAVDSSTPASSGVFNEDESMWRPTFIDPAALRSGTNVLAVEIHQAGPPSSDVSFDLELEGIR